MRNFSFALALNLFAASLSQPSQAQDEATLGAAEFGADLAAEIETVRNLCAQFFFVNPGVADEIQAEGFAMLSQVPEAKAKELLDQKIRSYMETVSATGPEPWCKSTRKRMQDFGGPFAALYAE